MDGVISKALDWDVNCGIARRAWAGNAHAIETAEEWNRTNDGHILLPFVAKEGLVESLVSSKLKDKRR